MKPKPGTKRAFQRKLRVYRYLFDHGNADPSEEQVNLWIKFQDEGLKYHSFEEPTVTEKVERKIELLKRVGLGERARKLIALGEREPFSELEKHLQQMKIRAGLFHPEELRKTQHGIVLDVLIHDYVSSHHDQAITAMRVLADKPEIKGYVGNDLEEVLFDIEQLAKIGFRSEYYGIKLTSQGYQSATSAIRKRRRERYKERHSFDRVVFQEFEPNKPLQYLVAVMDAEIPYELVVISSGRRGERSILPKKGVKKILGGSQIKFIDNSVYIGGKNKKFGYHYPKKILGQHFGNKMKFFNGDFSETQYCDGARAF
tara:strand:+ start:1295 stop:2236 length:942 start_codon:yes stop_codon:yes gene_type:complete